MSTTSSEMLINFLTDCGTMVSTPSTRDSSETAAVNSREYRIRLGGRIYNILSIDEMGFRHNSRKIHAQLAER